MNSTQSLLTVISPASFLKCQRWRFHKFPKQYMPVKNYSGPSIFSSALITIKTNKMYEAIVWPWTYPLKSYWLIGHGRIQTLCNSWITLLAQIILKQFNLPNIYFQTSLPDISATHFRKKRIRFLKSYSRLYNAYIKPEYLVPLLKKEVDQVLAVLQRWQFISLWQELFKDIGVIRNTSTSSDNLKFGIMDPTQFSTRGISTRIYGFVPFFVLSLDPDGWTCSKHLTLSCITF